MSVNRYLPHVFILPEDDANRQLATGFLLEPAVATRKIQILNEAGGWGYVLEQFKDVYVRDMEKYPKGFMVLLIDFDESSNRLETAKAVIPEHLKNRVFILGVWSIPEKLRSNCGKSYEKIGSALAKDCCDNTNETWAHHLLQHNTSELARLRDLVFPFLFSAY